MCFGKSAVSRRQTRMLTTLVKSAPAGVDVTSGLDNGIADAGDTIVFQMVITSSGGQALSSVEVSDAMDVGNGALGSIDCGAFGSGAAAGFTLTSTFLRATR